MRVTGAPGGSSPPPNSPRGAVDALAVLSVAEIEVMDRAQLDSVVDARRRLAAFVDAVDVRVARRSRQLAVEGRSEPATEVLRDKGRRSGRDAAAAAGREQACTAMPSFEDALGHGDVTSGHVDALARATARLDAATRDAFNNHEADLLADAARSSVEAFDKHCRDLARALEADDGAAELESQRRRNRVRQWVDHTTGMHHLHAELDPESGAKVWAAILAQGRTLTYQHDTDAHGDTRVPQAGESNRFERINAAAFIQLVTGSAVLDRRIPEVVVIIDHDTLVHGLGKTAVSETAGGVPLPPSTVRRLCCEANIIPVVMGGPSEVLDVGRARRLATPAQRRAIQALYATCCFPDCRVPVDQCEIHHLDEWLHHHGNTDLQRLAPVCVRDHHRIHDGGWTLDLDGDRNVTITRPDGHTTHHPPTTNRRVA